MIRLFKHYVPYAVLLLGVIDFALLILAAEAGWSLRLWQLGGQIDPDVNRLPNLLAFAGTLQAAMVAVGVYSVTALQSIRFATARLPPFSKKPVMASGRYLPGPARPPK